MTVAFLHSNIGRTWKKCPADAALGLSLLTPLKQTVLHAPALLLIQVLSKDSAPRRIQLGIPVQSQTSNQGEEDEAQAEEEREAKDKAKARLAETEMAHKTRRKRDLIKTPVPVLILPRLATPAL